MRRLVALIILVGCCFGCAVAPTARIVRAQIEIDSATLAGADQYAVYEITKAREYLHKAREEIGYSEYQVAMRYADLAVENGEKAKETAREHPTEAPAPPPQQQQQQPPPPPAPVIIQQTTPTTPAPSAPPLPTGNGNGQ